MSFFGFDASGKSKSGSGNNASSWGHNTSAPGFSQAHDPFAVLRDEDEGTALEFEDTYDGLGDQLDDGDDALNDDTFGDSSLSNTANVGKDFDFFGQTANVSNAIHEEQTRFKLQNTAARPVPGYQHEPAQLPTKPARSGYEKYSKPEPLPELQADATLWGVAASKASGPAAAAPVASATAATGRKMMSLEEVEAAMRAQAKPAAAAQATPEPIPTQQQYAPPVSSQQLTDFLHAQPQQPIRHVPSPSDHAYAQGQAADPQVTILQRPQTGQVVPGPPQPRAPLQQQPQQQPPTHDQHHQHVLQHHQQPGMPPGKPVQILQNPNRLASDATRIGMPHFPAHPGHPGHHRQHSSLSHRGIIPQASQLSHLSEEEKAAHLEQEARRAKRNHKIHLLSKDNGLMTPQDKNFITRIQLQQLVAATGNPIEHGSDDNIAEDFYYQVHCQIRGGYRQHPGQPLNAFAQTYLYQTGSRYNGNRRQMRGPENHVQRMEQQVQRAVEAAKNKPKNKQLVIEGSLGKISFSNAKTPKPLLNIKRNDSNSDAPHARPTSSAGKTTHAHSAVPDRKAVLADVEKVYSTLMKMEDHDRKMPPPQHGPDTEWLREADKLNGQLWSALKVHEPIGATVVHPFIAFLSCAKGKKAIPRVFRHVSPEQRTTILTMIVVHLDQLDVVRGAVQGGDGVSETLLNAALREKIELFSSAVVDTLFNFMAELPLDLVTGVLGLISNLNVDLIARSKIGASMLTMILSRAEILKQGGAPQNMLDTWVSTYNSFFNVLEPTLPRLFPGPVNSGQDIYVWQLLAALGIGANQDQQQRLVLGVKDRVMDTVALSKTLPIDMAQPRLQNVNLFMRSIGLDVELLV